MFNNSIPGPIYVGSTLHAVVPGDSAVAEPVTLNSGTWTTAESWLSATSLMVLDGTDTAGRFNLHALNIGNGNIIDIWKGSIHDYAIDPENEIIAYGTSDFESRARMGLYFFAYLGKRMKVFPGWNILHIFFRGGEKNRFTIQGGGDAVPMDGDVVGLNLAGEPAYLGKFNADAISVSPDHRWLILRDTKNLFLFDSNDELIKTIPYSGIMDMIWRPDSQAVYFSADSRLFTLNIPNGEIFFMDDCASADCWLSRAAWLP